MASPVAPTLLFLRSPAVALRQYLYFCTRDARKLSTCRVNQLDFLVLVVDQDGDWIACHARLWAH
jgi:hypothetical protein